ncbi:hypothetical protein F4802DRAFT_118314 [Xylaria palmicola]|nr:hypothetical protein F4802DRAFT_118314 [Xylaria palmicola]
MLAVPVLLMSPGWVVSHTHVINHETETRVLLFFFFFSKTFGMMEFGVSRKTLIFRARFPSFESLMLYLPGHGQVPYHSPPNHRPRLCSFSTRKKQRIISESIFNII